MAATVPWGRSGAGTGAGPARQDPDVRRRAHRIARLLAPAAAALGGFASAEARVETGLGIRLRPDVCVSLGEPPYDGLLVSPPLLVVVLATPGAVGAWLALGTEAVWTTAGGQGRRHQADGTVVAVPPSGTLDVPGRPGLELGVGELLARQASVVEQPAVRSARLLR